MTSGQERGVHDVAAVCAQQENAGTAKVSERGLERSGHRVVVETGREAAPRDVERYRHPAGTVDGNALPSVEVFGEEGGVVQRPVRVELEEDGVTLEVLKGIGRIIDALIPL